MATSLERGSRANITRRWLGIDFSGNYRMWLPTSSASNVWIADVHASNGQRVLHALQRVQHLSGSTPPFTRLVDLLASGEYEAAAIDAPFSVPARFVPDAGHAGLLEAVASMPLRENRPFPEAKEFVRRVTDQERPDPLKPLRATERLWSQQGINVRSTLWAGRRGGAAMTAACLTLLHRARRPIWPWAEATAGGLLVEAFPAAQLKHWHLPHDGYNGDTHTAFQRRAEILERLSTSLKLSPFRADLEGSADALDAVLCAFAALAVTSGNIVVPPDATAGVEGWIAVHSEVSIYQERGRGESPGPREGNAMETALVLITADPGKDRAVAGKVKGVPGAEGVSLVSGLYDVVATVKGPTAKAILDTVYDKIRTIPGVRGSHTMFCAPA